MDALELICGYTTAPDTTLTGITLCSGNSLTVRNAADGSETNLLAVWSKQQTAGNVRVRSPQLHDNVQGMRFFSPAADPEPLFPMGIKQKLIAQDTLVVEQSGSSTAADLEEVGMLLHYEDLPGIDARLINNDEVKSKFVNLMCVENTLALGTSGDYTGEEAINAEFDQFKANTDYALLGYTVSVICNAVRWRGSDSGNLGIGGPGNAVDKFLTSRWFMWLSAKTGIPLIPVFNSSNKFSLLVDGQQDEDGADVLLTSIFAELK